jgi:hypothetical protein
VYENWAANLTVVATTLVAVVVAVLVHYEGLVLVSRWIVRAGERPARRRVLHAMFAVLGLHIVEIWVFGVAMWLLVQWPACGHIAGDDPLVFFDAVYLSAMTFTTVGFGDISPVGPVRFLAGTEALTGFVLIGWTASFTYLEMERFWRVR